MNESINNFTDLEAWKEAHKFVQVIYLETEKLPDIEKYGLLSQIRRASISITANIAEGFARYYFKDKIRFYYNSRGSLAEVQNFLYLINDLGYVPEDKVNNLLEKSSVVYKLLN